MKSLTIKWGSTFLIGLILLLGTYYFTMDFEYLSYDVTNQGQLVIQEGWDQPSPIINSDVSDKKEGLEELGVYMERFNRWLIGVMIVVAVFIATNYVFFNKPGVRSKTKRKKSLFLMITINVAAATVLIIQWIHFADVINKSIHDVMFY